MNLSRFCRAEIEMQTQRMDLWTQRGRSWGMN